MSSSEDDVVSDLADDGDDAPLNGSVFGHGCSSRHVRPASGRDGPTRPGSARSARAPRPRAPWVTPTLLAGSILGAVMTCERISEVDEDEEEDDDEYEGEEEEIKGEEEEEEVTVSSTASAIDVNTPSSCTLTPSTPCDEALVGDDRDDETLADLSTVSSLSTLSNFSDLDRDLVGEDESAGGWLVEEVANQPHLDALPGSSLRPPPPAWPQRERLTREELSPQAPPVQPPVLFLDEDLGESKLEATALGCVLEEAVDQLCILAHTSRAAELAPLKVKHSLDERLEAIDARETERKNSVIPVLGAKMSSLSDDENAKVDKIQRDRAMVQEALRLQLAWINGPYGPYGPRWPRGEDLLLESPLCRLVREEEQRVTEEALMLVDSAKGASSTDLLRARVFADEREVRRQLAAMRAERAQLQEEARGLRARAALGAAIVGRWERSRLQQHQRHLQDQEQSLRDALSGSINDHHLEERAHCELIEYLQQASESLEQQSEEWQALYDEVTASWDAKLAALKAERQEHARRLRAVRKELVRRERFKRDFLIYKTARDQMIEERIRMHNAATRIQSWWRMTMVRKGFGPWKRMAKKKKKKKK